MARSRNIKPGFFANEDLVELDFATRILFAGLWTVADKEGRLEDRPKKIKMAIFPADSVEVDQMLDDLARYGFIHRYEIDGEKYIQVAAWHKHQSPHHTEKESLIPDIHGVLTVKHPSKTSDSRKQDGGNPPDSLLLIPDSLPKDSDKSEASDVVDPCPHQKVIDLYHKHVPTGRKVREWTPARSTALRARWREKKERQSLEWWARFFSYVGKSDFLTGRVSSHGRKPFEVSLDWLVKTENMAKVIEGAYENDRAAA